MGKEQHKKSTDALMRHLRNSGIAISGGRQKRLLVNTGYYHGYKGYRFFKSASNRLPFTTYDQIYNTIQYDTKLKALLYGKVMFIETALKNIACECILREIGSGSIHSMCNSVVKSYNNASAGTPPKLKRKWQENKLSLQSTIQRVILNSYRKDDPKIAHFQNNPHYDDVPLWALFEVLTMGDFGYLLSCLTFDMRKEISTALGISVTYDTNCELIYKYVYTLKDLRNAIAHNDVVYDTRFREIDPTRAMKSCLIAETGLSYVNFKTITDYVILISFFLKKLRVSKTEMRSFVREYERITDEYIRLVGSTIASQTVHADTQTRLAILKTFT